MKDFIVENIHLSKNEIKVLKTINKNKEIIQDEHLRTLRKLVKLDLIDYKDCGINALDGEYDPNPPYSITDKGKSFLVFRHRDVSRAWYSNVIATIALLVSIIAIILSVLPPKPQPQQEAEYLPTKTESENLYPL